MILLEKNHLNAIKAISASTTEVGSSGGTWLPQTHPQFTLIKTGLFLSQSLRTMPEKMRNFIDVSQMAEHGFIQGHQMNEVQ